ncbi:hypothetical protein GS399_08615 [Pedobacter sp. HMF7647]|uniref:Uncharacterized protein n=1 Tax=Hufsiella arboris TaxID=2695275 RepID=A0A7K1Y8V3_9SPHI|nr:hypothetical protein [Hufsiella arboris]MXV51033.1 hypothetical protein [Hufsiella arboris]
MKLSKALISALIVGITVQAAGCKKDDAANPETTNGKKNKKTQPYSCPGCGMG